MALILILQLARAQDKLQLPPASAVGAAGNGAVRLAHAAKMNGLSTVEGAPWHMKISFKLFDQNDEVRDQGALEIFWASQYKFKTIYANSTSKQVIVGTKFGNMRSGDTNDIPVLVNFISRNYLNPIVAKSLSVELPVEIEHKERDGAAFECLTATSIDSVGPDMRPSSPISDCVDPHSYALRLKIFEAGVHEDLFDNPVFFRGRFLPGDLLIRQQGRPIATAHLETIEAINSINEADFVPLTDSIPMPNPAPVKLPDGIALGMLIKKVEPKYPFKSKMAKVEGTVVVHLVIGKDGHPSHIEAISGPPELQEAVIKAVKHWVYKPYTLNGEAVEVDSTITSVFKLGR